jgi:hypothetical protein
MKIIKTIVEQLLPLVQLVPKLTKDLPVPIGRWKIENCAKQMNNKIDLSNEDHSGPCGQYILEKAKLKNKTTVSK